MPDLPANYPTASFPDHFPHSPAFASQAMRQALALAAEATGLSDPNPRVGCLLISPSGELLGQGHTQAAGQAHAEVMALRDAAARGKRVSGAVAYVTLEPCSHHGRTPPCCNALIDAGIGHVVAAVEDPNPSVAGQGLARLRDAGISVCSGLHADAARELNIGFFSRMLRQRPFVRLKAAISLDGRTALSNGQSQWITSPEARQDGHAWRKRAGAVLTGYGTLRDDNPRLDVRLVPTARQPLRVLVDARLQADPSSRLFEPPGEVLVFHAAVADEGAKRLLQTSGVTLCERGNGQGKVDLSAMLLELGQRGINELHIEAGHRLNASLLKAGLVDELLVYMAPKLLGEGAGLAALGPFEHLSEAALWHWIDVEMVGPDLRLRLRPQ